MCRGRLARGNAFPTTTHVGTENALVPMARGQSGIRLINSFVEGHGFSRAAYGPQTMGFSP